MWSLSYWTFLPACSVSGCRPSHRVWISIQAARSRTMSMIHTSHPVERRPPAGGARCRGKGGEMIQESHKRALQPQAAGLAAPIHGSQGRPPHHARKQALSTKTQRRRPRHRHHPPLPNPAARPFSQDHNAAKRLRSSKPAASNPLAIRGSRFMRHIASVPSRVQLHERGSFALQPRKQRLGALRRSRHRRHHSRPGRQGAKRRP